jgi:thiol:disulfide interchange protein
MKIARSLILTAALTLAAASTCSAASGPYPSPSLARQEIAAALRTAAAAHKRILLDFGGNWCPDCIALDQYFHNPSNLPILQPNFVLVFINVGQLDQNVSLAAHYGIPLSKGVPALAVLSSRGKLLYSQKNGQFNEMASMQSSAVTQFLIRWKPVRPGCSEVMLSC